VSLIVEFGIIQIMVLHLAVHMIGICVFQINQIKIHHLQNLITDIKIKHTKSGINKHYKASMEVQIILMLLNRKNG